MGHGSPVTDELPKGVSRRGPGFVASASVNGRKLYKTFRTPEDAAEQIREWVAERVAWNRGGRPAKPGLPSRPLADAVQRLAMRQGLGEVCWRAGIPERVFTRWRLGESSADVSPELADQVLTRLGLLWWDVWNEDTVREPLFVVVTYVSQVKKRRNGTYRRYRVKDRTIPYGDLGTDYWRLREVEALMAGERLVA